MQTPEYIIEQLMEGLKHALLCNKADRQQKVDRQKEIKRLLTTIYEIDDVSPGNMVALSNTKIVKSGDKAKSAAAKEAKDLAEEFCDLQEEVKSMEKSIGYKEDAVKILTNRIQANKSKFIEGTSLAELNAARVQGGNPQKFSDDKLRTLHYMGLFDRSGSKIGKTNIPAPPAATAHVDEVVEVRSAAASSSSSAGVKRNSEAAKLGDFLGAPALKKK